MLPPRPLGTMRARASRTVKKVPRKSVSMTCSHTDVDTW